MPEDKEEYNAWYQRFIDFSVELILNGGDTGFEVQDILSGEIRGLCRCGLYKEVSQAARKIRGAFFWPSGYAAIHETLKFDKEQLNADTIRELKDIKSILAPATDEERAILMITSHFGEDDDFWGEKTSIDQRALLAEETGRTIALQPDTLSCVVYESVRENNWLAFSMGRGVAVGASNHEMAWESMFEIYCDAPKEKRNPAMLGGFLSALHEINQGLCSCILERAASDHKLKNVYVYFQSRVPLDEVAISRIKNAISSDIHDVWSFQDIAFSKGLTSLTPALLEEILMLIANRPGGSDVAIEIFSRLFHDEIEGNGLRPEHRELGRKLIFAFDFASKPYHNTSADRHLQNIFASSFPIGEEDKDDLIALLKRLCDEISRNTSIFNNNLKFFRALIQKAPLDFLNVFLHDDIKVDSYYLDVIKGSRSEAPLWDNIEPQTIITWCSLDPKARYPWIAQIITPYARTDEGYSWCFLARHILSTGIDVCSILDVFYESMWPTQWSDSRALIVKPRIALVAELCHSDNEDIRTWAHTKLPEMQRHVNDELEAEEKRNRSEERFE